MRYRRGRKTTYPARLAALLLALVLLASPFSCPYSVYAEEEPETESVSVSDENITEEDISAPEDLTVSEDLSTPEEPTVPEEPLTPEEPPAPAEPSAPTEEDEESPSVSDSPTVTVSEDPEEETVPDPEPPALITLSLTQVSDLAVSVDKINGRASLSWSPSGKAKGYAVFRRNVGEGSAVWSLIATREGRTNTSYLSLGIPNGNVYAYAVCPYYLDLVRHDGKIYITRADAEALVSTDLTAAGEDPVMLQKYKFSLTGAEPLPGCTVSRVSYPEDVTVTRLTPTSVRIRWNINGRADGYEVQWSRSRFFTDPKTMIVDEEVLKDPGAFAITRSASFYRLTVTGLAEGRKYYARVRGYKLVDGARVYSEWTLNPAALADSTAATSSFKDKNGKTLELYRKAGQKLYGYDTMQGGVSDGTYLYYILYNRGIEDCKIAKIRMDNHALVKVSQPLGAWHGNDLAYNPVTGDLVVVHATGDRKVLTVVDRKTLAVSRRVTVTIPKTLPGDHSGRCAKVTGFMNISYDPVTGGYLAMTTGKVDLMMLDRDFNPVRIIPLRDKKEDGYYYQGLDVYRDYILVTESCYSNSIACVYDRSGRLISETVLKKGWEVENITHTGGAFYIGCYRAYDRPDYKYVRKQVTKTKTVKKTRYKMVNGVKTAYKVKVKKKYKVWKTVRVRQEPLVRESRVWRVYFK